MSDATIPWHLATLTELIADRIPDRSVLVHGATRRTYRDYDDRASRLAGAFDTLGVQPHASIALCLLNCVEYKEAELAIGKLRGVAVHVNYRYVADELVYLLDNADAQVLIYHRRFADRVRVIRERLPLLRHVIEVEDGSAIDTVAGALRYEALIVEHAPAPRIERSGSDTVIVYTGGTTGLPKGVLYAQDANIRFTTIGYEFYGLPVPDTTKALIEAAAGLASADIAPVSLVCAPFMHSIGSTLGHAMTVLMGGTVVMMEAPSFDADEAWSLVERECITQIVLVGDAVARPLLSTLDAADAAGMPRDVGSVRLIASSGVMWTKEVKSGLLRHGDMKLIDFLGSSEGGMGMSIATRTQQAETARFRARPNIRLLADDDSEIPWGSDSPGRIAATGNIPHAYHKDPERTAMTFREIGGVRYSIPGDYATIDADGVVTMLGRGSGCINTGGEKVFAEEVEEAVKRYPSVQDCVVVGVADDRFGFVVAAVVSLMPGAAFDRSALIAFLRDQLAAYKAPRSVTIVPEVQRGTNGKADYGWARRVAEADRAAAVFG